MRMPVGATLASRAPVSLAFARIGFYFDRDYGLIVEFLNAGGMRSYRLENLPQQGLRGLGRAVGNDRCHTIWSKRMALTVTGIQNAVAVEHEHVAMLRPKTELVIIGFVEQTEWQSSRLDELD